MAKYNERNEEIPDKRPIAVPLGYEVPESLSDMIARMVRTHSVIAARNGAETFEESDDFDVDDEEMTSQYELKPMQEEYVQPKPVVTPPAPAPAPTTQEKTVPPVPVA